MKRLAIDPGDLHVGWAYDGDGIVVAGEWTPIEACNRLVDILTRDRVDELVIEEFVLYQREYANQTWSSMKTSQLIGALKWIAYMFRVKVVEQSATIKKATERQIKARGIKLVRGSDHAIDAQLHLHYRRIRSEEEACQSQPSLEGSSGAKAKA